MLKRKVFLFVLLGLLLPFVSAAVDPVQISQGVSDFFTFVFGIFFGAVASAELLFIKFLVFILLFVIIKFTLNRLPPFQREPGISIIISVVISLIAVRYLTSDALVNLIWLPYGALGIALSSIFPLIIFFYFIESIDSDAMRKIGWVMFGVIYFALAILRWDSFAVGGEWWQNLAWFYFIVGIISFFVLVFDKQIRVKMVLSAIRRGEDTHSLVLKGELQEELRSINKTLASSHLTKREENKLKEEKSRIEKAIARIS